MFARQVTYKLKEEYVNAKQEVRRECKHDIYNNHRGFMQIRRWMNRESLFEIVLNAKRSPVHDTHLFLRIMKIRISGYR